MIHFYSRDRLELRGGIVDSRAIVDGVYGEVARRFASSGSPLVDGSGLEVLAATQVRSILWEALGACSSERRVVGTEGEVLDLSAEGRRRAEQGLHPADALHLAEVVFDAALPVFVREFGVETAGSAMEVSRLLHHAIWRRFPAGAVAYTESLRQQLLDGHLESRFRLSRELHDRIAHDIVAGMQRLQLIDLPTTLSDDAAANLEAATLLFSRSLEEVQNLAVGLRSRVAGRPLEDAVASFVEDGACVGPVARLDVVGASQKLKSRVSEEILLVAQEAIHNARRHAKSATAVIVTLTWSQSTLRVTVADDGDGFDPRAVGRRALGLKSMTERAEGVGAFLTVESESGAGTTVTMVVPLDGFREVEGSR